MIRKTANGQIAAQVDCPLAREPAIADSATF